MIKNPAIGILELNSVARGISACDGMVKKAPVEILASTPICPGKYLIIISGEVAPIDEALQAGILIGQENIVDKIFIPNIHPDIAPAIVGTTVIKELDSIGIIETFSVGSTVMAADKAAKAANIKLIELRLAKGLGGKAFFTMTGELAEVEAAVEAGCAEAKKEGMLVRSEIIAAPHPDLTQAILGGTL